MKEQNLHCGSIEAARRAGISLRQLYHWVDVLQVVRPEIWQHGIRKFRRFTHQDIDVLREVRFGLERGYTLRAAVRRVKEAGDEKNV